MNRRLRRLGLILTIIFLLMPLLAPVLQHLGILSDPNEFLSNPIHAAPSWQYIFGTDQQGHDILARSIAGAGVAWQVVIASTFLSLVIGVPLGMISGYQGGWLDRVLVFFMDALYTIPGLLLSITIAFVVGQGVWNAAIALSVSYIPQYFRVIRNQTVSVKTELFIEAAQALGANTWTVLTKYLAQNVIQTIPVFFTLNAADAILTLAGLGFLGLGVPEDIPEWGHDLKQALDALSTGENVWWTTLFPGLAITLMVVGLSLLGEGLTQKPE
ncbi:ABC-type dipeptide/oligopeptide/nickel transport system, permease component [Synechococcus sp. PCC 7502]|uniref:ABC transporter permease n=1 Tax=Synechococcus sp. PCC 7502 TaxID=1173263 RepID=UPI00029FE08A|nr:ABC transporter permease [Synechococcus sp. PCC 7502]AFY74668.1 ABC-type dipeptide/oligopeptide/nickel transport system, permease component [Synechococcus sp. PCC 7502]